MNALRKAVFSLVLVVFAGASLYGCESEGPAESAGKKVDEAMEDAGDAMDDAKEKMEEAMEEKED